VDGLAQAIADLLEDPEGARQIGTKLRHRVEENFSWQNTAQQLVKAYALAISRKTDS
jgi:glycosyltransferase involved in cell wall biosynthesis